MQSPIRAIIAYSIALSIALSFVTALAHAGNDNWPDSGNGRKNTRNQPKEKKISADNVGSLIVKWQRDLDGEISANPAVVQKRLYVTDWGGSVWKLKASDGSTVWRRSVAEFTGTTGDFSRNTPAVNGHRLFIGNQGGRVGGGTAKVIALDTRTGNELWVTEVDNHPLSIVTAAPVVRGNTVYVGVSSMEEGAAANPAYPCCSFRGSVVALNKKTGAIKWKTYTTPDPDIAPGYAGNAVWSSAPVVDTKRKLLYVTTGNTYKVPEHVLACVTPLLPETPENADQLRACDPQFENNYFDSVLALDLKTGDIVWAHRTHAFDSWTVGCLGSGFNCDGGPDYDFGQAPALFKVKSKHKHKRDVREILGVGQKSGVYWGVNPDTGEEIYRTQVGPGGTTGGAQWGSATDGKRAYVAIANSDVQPWTIQAGPMTGQITFGGLWSALDGATGEILWQTPDPNGATSQASGAVSVANGVVYAGSTGTLFPPGSATDQETMIAMDAATGEILYSFIPDASVLSGPSISNGTLYWGSGYNFFDVGGTLGNTLYAFKLAR